MFDLLKGKGQSCEFDGVEAVTDFNGRYCQASFAYKVSFGEGKLFYYSG